MEKLLEEFNLKKEITDLVGCYFEPPFNWTVYQLGIYKYNGKLHSFCNYTGQGVEEPIYNGTAEYTIEILDDILNYFDISANLKDYTEKEKNEYIDFICDNVSERIKEFEKQNV